MGNASFGVPLAQWRFQYSPRSFCCAIVDHIESICFHQLVKSINRCVESRLMLSLHGGCCVHLS